MNKEHLFNCVSVRRTEMVHYVNSPSEGESPRERTGTIPAGGSKIFHLIGISFGLLCIIVFILNVSLRLHAVGFSNRSENGSICNSTLMSPGDIRALILERDQLLQDNHRLTEEKKQLNGEKEQLVREKTQLANEKTDLQVNNRILNENVTEQQDQIKDLQTKLKTQPITPACPPEWMAYMSSCYQLSSMISTWDYAKQDCIRKGAHLVILNNSNEEKIVHCFGGVKMWIGLRGRYHRSTYSWTWKWVDNSPLTYGDWSDWQPRVRYRSDGCVFKEDCLKTWFVDDCQHQHYWMCEKELYTDSN